MITLTFYSDPGHGWLKVPVELIETLEINNKISEYSYVSHAHGTAFLEEDCDAHLFDTAMKAKGLAYDYVSEYHHGESWIRNLPRWRKYE